MTEDSQSDSKRSYAAAIIIHWGDVGPTIRVAEEQVASGQFDRVAVIANDLSRVALGDDRVEWLVPPRNLGYGGACRFGAEMIDAKLYAFLNTDLSLCGDAANRCLRALEVENVGIAAPVLLYENGHLQSGCGTWSRLLRMPQAHQWPREELASCEWVTGAALFCRGDVLREVGIDASYFMGFEDADFCERARGGGWSVVVVRDARGIHPGGATMAGGRWQYYSLRNGVWFSRRRRGFLQSIGCWLWTACVLLPRVLVADLVKKRGYVRTYSAFRAVVDATATLPVVDPWPDEPMPQKWMAW
jgi:N-acetylglucosaminyl-diphospho-decaprenol L-rhamnosyltransferase